MTTFNEILAAAYGRSSKNIPGKIATDAVELLNLMHRALSGLYSFAADINPQYFGVTSAVVFAAGGWARPAGAENVWRIELVNGTEVVTVPIDDKQAELGKPAVYRLGAKYFSAGNALDPTAVENLVFYYSKTPTKPVLLADVVDPTWPDAYNPLLIDEVALWLAIKDGRQDEVGEVKASRDGYLKLFEAFLDHETTNEVRRMGTTFHSQRRVNIGLALMGGAK